MLSDKLNAKDKLLYNFSAPAEKGGNMKKEHLNFNDRICIQACIEKLYGLAKTAKIVRKNKSTVYREIISNCYYKDGYKTCSHCVKDCRTFDNHFGNCENFVPRPCTKWKKFPYTCNKCGIKHYCKMRRRYYDCTEAQEQSKKTNSINRKYRCISPIQLQYMNNILKDAIKEKGQSLHHCYVANQELRKICSERTIRRYIYNGYFETKAHDLPRFVRYKKEYSYARPKIINVERMIGRTYKDFEDYVKANPNINIWQYDSVIGKHGDKNTILTITFPKTRFQFGILLKGNKCNKVLAIMRYLQDKLKSKFQTIFAANLSDNGPEFSLFHEAEFDTNGERICRIFFANPYRSTDKAACERNHEFIRYIIPKGHSLDFLDQQKVNKMFSHINSYIRESNQNKTPYELTLESFGSEFMELIGIEAIPVQDVCLKPELLK